MKHVTHIIFCMLCMLCLFDATAVAQVNSSDEFFTLYLKDGTSRNFYTGDIISITHSNIDIDGTIYDEPVVQEICMSTGAERYRLADIEEMSFERLNIPFDVRASVEKWEIVSEAVNKMLEGKSIYELAEHKVEIENLDNVVAVEFRENLMEVTLDDGTVKKWYEPIEAYEVEEEVSYSKAFDSFSAKGLNAVPYHTPAHGMKVLIVNQLFDSEIYDFREGTIVLKTLRKDLEQKGFCVEDSKPFTPHLFSNMTEYDVIVFYTHGDFDGKQHWLLTKTSLTKTEHSNYWDPKYFCLWENHKDGNGKSYLAVSESWIKEVSNLKQDAIIISSACQSLKGNDNLAESFIHNGASFFVGYDDTVIRSYKAINMFVSELAKDKTIKEAYDLTYEEYGERSYIHPETWALRNAKLHAVTANGKEDYVNTTCFNHADFFTAKPEECNISETSAYLGVKIQNLDGLKQKYENIQEIGVMYTPDKDNWTGTNVKKITLYEYSWKDGVIRGQTLGKLQMEKEYWYRAYLKTGAGVIVLGEVEKFVTNDKEAREELKIIYEQIGDKSWHNWLDEQTPITNWDFVYLSNEGIGYNVDLAYVYYSKDNPNVVLKDLKRIHSISFPCVSNNSKLESLTISNCPNLEKIPNMRTKHLEIDSCEKLRSFSFYSDVATLDLTNCPKIVDLNVDYTKNMESIRIANCSSLEELSAESSNLRSLEIEYCPLLKKLNLFSSKVEGVLNLSGAPNLEKLDCSFSKVTRLIITSRVLSSLECLNAPIDQKIESIPNWEFFEWEINQNRKFVYGRSYDESDSLIQLQKDGWKILQKETKGDNSYYVMYKYNYDDHHGFYHEGEPSVEAYYTWW